MPGYRPVSRNTRSSRLSVGPCEFTAFRSGLRPSLQAVNSLQTYPQKINYTLHLTKPKILSIVLASLFLFGCSSETSSSSQPEQSSVPAPVSSVSEVQPVPSSSVSSSTSSVSSSRLVLDLPIDPANGPVPRMLEKGWHYSTSRWRYGWVKDGQEFVFCHDSMLDLDRKSVV